jgi:hypothetical protein
MTALAGWENFYVIVGSAAGAPIGLQFVVVTLIADSPVVGVGEGVTAFATPTIVHFGVVLLLSAVASVPWHKIGTVSVVWGLVGLSGIVYAVIVSRRLRVQTIYQAKLETAIRKPRPSGLGCMGMSFSYGPRKDPAHPRRKGPQ